MWMLLLAVVVLAAANALTVLLAPGWYVLVCVVAAVLLVLIARRSGLTWDDLRLGRAAARRSLRWGLVLAGAVLVVYLVGLALPLTREAFQHERAAWSSWESYRAAVRSTRSEPRSSMPSVSRTRRSPGRRSRLWIWYVWGSNRPKGASTATVTTSTRPWRTRRGQGCPALTNWVWPSRRSMRRSCPVEWPRS